MIGYDEEARLDALYSGLVRLREEGFPVDAIVPMGAIYLTARFFLHGRGGQGVVYLATQLSTGRHVAVKVMRPDLADVADRALAGRHVEPARPVQVVPLRLVPAVPTALRHQGQPVPGGGAGSR